MPKKRLSEKRTVQPKPKVKEKQLTFDGFDNFLARVGINNDNVLSAGQYTFNLLTRNRIELEACYRGSWIAGQVIDAIPIDMTKAGIDISTSEDEKGIKKIQNAISRLRIASSLRENLSWGRLYGGSIAVVNIEGQDQETELDVETVAENSFKGLTVYDRWQVQPDLTELIEDGPAMGYPMYYSIVTSPRTVGGGESAYAATAESGQYRIHHSRIIRSIGILLPYFQAITEMMWGESEIERLWDRLIAFDQATMSAANLIEHANNRTVGIDKLREIIAAGGKAQQGLEKMFEMMQMMQTNEGLTLLDKEDTFQTTSYTFAGLSDVLLQFGQQVSGASGIPLVRLFGQSPAGLSATGESDLRIYYDNVNARQESDLRPGWDLLLKVLWRSVLGKAAPEDLEFTFTPLWQTSLLDKATIAKSTAETISGAFESGLISRVTALKELRQSSAEHGLFSNITDEDVAEAEEEAENPPMPGEGPAGEAGDPDPTSAGGGEPPTPAPTEKPASEKKSISDRLKAWVAR